MPISYENRKGELHFVKAVKTKKGGTRYYIVKDKTKYKSADLLEEIPQGFEFYEFPFDGLVSFRKKIKTKITAQDFSILDSVMKKHKIVKEYIIDIEHDALRLYISGNYDDLLEIIGKEKLKMFQTFNEKLRFEKTENDLFRAQRYCYLGSFDDWITIETSDDLEYLAEKYCYHADKESLLEFWIEGEEYPEPVLVGEIDGTPVYRYLKNNL